MNQRRRKIFELLPNKGKINFLSSSPQKEKLIKLNNYDSDKEDCYSSTKSKTLEKKKKISENKKNYSTLNLKRIKKKESIEIIKEKKTENQKNFLIKILTENELLYPEMDREIIEKILDIISYEKVKKKKKIFTQDDINKDYYIIIEKGKIEYSIDDEKYELEKENGIGTKVLLENCQVNCYIKTLSKCYLFILPFEKYKNIANDYEKKRNEEIIKYLQKSFFFSNLNYDTQLNIAKISNFLDCEEKTLILEENKLSDSIYLILKGNVFCSYNNLIIKYFKEGDLFGEIGIFNSIESLYTYTSDKETIILKIKYEDLIPIFREQSFKNIIFQIFQNAIKENIYLNQFLNTEEKINEAFNNFQLKFYFENIIINKEQNKVILPISGSIFKGKKNQELQNFIHFINSNYMNEIPKGKIFMESLLIEENNKDINYNIYGDECIIFEIEWDILIQILYSNKIKEESIHNLIYILKNNPQFNFLSLFNLFSLANSMEKKIYDVKEIILKEGPLSDKFFYIKEGKIEIKNKEKKINILSSNQYFGDITSEKGFYSRKADFISLTKSIIYTIEKKIYEEIVDKENPLFKTLKKILMLNDITISLDSLFYVKDIGSGSYGKVYLVNNKQNYYAIKTVELKYLNKNKNMAKLYLSEKLISSNLNHPFIVHFFNTYKTRDYLFFLMEFVDGISLRKKISESKKKNILKNYEETQFYGAILLSVLNYLQKKRIIHRDLKPDNIIINTNGYLKVIDFGVSKNLETKDYTNTIIGTSYYMSPEVILGKPYNFNADYWSLGVILYEIYYGKLPFGNKKEQKCIYDDILNLKLNLVDTDFKSEDFNHLITCLLEKNQKNRISSFKAIKNHKFFQGFDFESLMKFMIKPSYIPKETVRKYNNNENISFLAFMKNNNYQSSNDLNDIYINKQVDDILFFF